MTSAWATPGIVRIRERCKTDVLYLAREILGEAYAQANGGVNLFRTPAPYHYEAAEVLQGHENAIILAPRGHLKTELVTIAGTICYLLGNPNRRVLIVSETPKVAMKSLRAIKDTMASNRRFRTLFPEYRIDSSDEEGTRNWFDVPCRTGPKKDFSVEVIGVGGATAGGHFDRIVTTDIVSNLTVPPAVTPETMMKTWDFVNALEPLLNKSNKQSHIIIEGTVWSMGDPYCLALENPGYAHYRKIVYSCWDREKRHPDGRRMPMWPELHTTEELERIRAKDERLFSCYYENDPQPASDERLFMPSYFKYYEAYEGVCPCCEGALEIRFTCDLAISQARTADYTAIVVSGVCPRGSLVVLAVARGRWSPYETVEKLYALDALWKPSYIGIESVAWQKAMLHILQEEASRKGRYHLNVWEMIPDNSPNGKLRRIGMLSALAASRGIWVRRGDHDELVDEALRMSRKGTLGGHDDMIDALGYVATWMAEPAAPVLEAEVVDRPLLMGASSIKGSDALAMLARRSRRLGTRIP